MAVAATCCSTFSLFPSLPPELRNQIWHDALPSSFRPALYFYKKGFWCPRRLSESDEGYDPSNDELNLNFEFRHDLLDDADFEVPLVFVNREARGIALGWVREQGIKIRPCEGDLFPAFVRPFDPLHDALYVALDRLNDFWCEPGDRQAQPDLLEQLVNVHSEVTRIAVPEALLPKEVAPLRDMFLYYCNVRVLYIVIGAQPDPQSKDNDKKLQRWWELDNTRGGALIWNQDRKGFDREDVEHMGDEARYKLIEEAAKGLGEVFAREFIRSFEIRPIFAVKR